MAKRTKWAVVLVVLCGLAFAGTMTVRQFRLGCPPTLLLRPFPPTHPLQGDTPIRLSNVAQEWGVLSTDTRSVAIFDHDGDGDLDIYLGRCRFFPGIRSDFLLPDRLFRNDGTGRFTEIGEAAGIAMPTFTQTVTAVDFDGDRDTDLFVGTGPGTPNILWRNNGDGTYTDVAKRVGLAGSEFCRGAAFADVDADGDLDVYIGNAMPLGAPGRVGYRGRPNKLLLNDGGNFRDSNAPGLEGLPNGEAWTSLLADLDGDFRTDLFVTNDTRRDQVFRNTKAGDFDEMGDALYGPLVSRASSESPLRYTGCMGLALGDYDNDLDLDLYCANAWCDRLYRQDAPFRYSDAAMAAGVVAATRDLWGMGVVFADLDLDGWLDLFVSNGRQESYDPEPMLVLQNNRDGTFAKVDPGSALDAWRHSWAVASGDLDGDGDVDLVVAHDMHGDNVSVLRNDTQTDHHWLRVEVVGETPNTRSVGARVTLEGEDISMVRLVYTGDSLHGSSSPFLHFGLGSSSRFRELRVDWPDGASIALGAGTADRIVRVGRIGELPPRRGN